MCGWYLGQRWLLGLHKMCARNVFNFAWLDKQGCLLKLCCRYIFLNFWCVNHGVLLELLAWLCFADFRRITQYAMQHLQCWFLCRDRLDNLHKLLGWDLVDDVWSNSCVDLHQLHCWIILHNGSGLD